MAHISENFWNTLVFEVIFVEFSSGSGTDQSQNFDMYGDWSFATTGKWTSLPKVSKQTNFKGSVRHY